MILVDTSIWIELIRGKMVLSEEQLESVAVCGPIIQEVLQGLDDSIKGQAFRDNFAEVTVIGDPVTQDLFVQAAEIYLVGRRNGYTIRSSSDCLIAAIAIRSGYTVWHRDRDYEHIAKFTRLATKADWGVQ